MGIWPLPTQETSERRIRRGWPWGCPEEAGKLGAEDGEARGTGAAGVAWLAAAEWRRRELRLAAGGSTADVEWGLGDGRLCLERRPGGRWGRRFAGEGAHRLPRFLGGSPELPWDCRREFGDAEEPRSTAAGSGTQGGCWLPSRTWMRSAGHGCHGGEGWIGGVPGLSSFRDERGGWSGPLTAGGEEDSLPLALEEQDLPLPVAGGRRGSFRCLPPVARLDLKGRRGRVAAVLSEEDQVGLWLGLKGNFEEAGSLLVRLAAGFEAAGSGWPLRETGCHRWEAGSSSSWAMPGEEVRRGSGGS
ncbi:hypothetical protein MLD38_010824 [Melastoma candidum]|uniref:Uncharacterized protein n=1 Tax=Melastoma candidum TaxID=119954 RepID=A0ACB9R0K5_9MYRT|nr:hypothetical protein MLD38_010824 [Melastoma candidum]